MTLRDDPDDSAQLRARGEATDRQQTQLAKHLGVVWQSEILEERRQMERARKRSGQVITA